MGNNLTTLPMSIGNLDNIIWSGYWIDGDYSYLHDNKLCPIYPECIEEYVGWQDTEDCPEFQLGDFIHKVLVKDMSDIQNFVWKLKLGSSTYSYAVTVHKS